MPLLLCQALVANAGDEFLRRAVVEDLRWCGRFVAEINVDRVSLCGSDLRLIFVELKPLFVVFSDDGFQLLPRYRFATGIDPGQ